ncbi:potassium channel family protein [Streptomyces sp. NBC_00237]|uniref:potassium channel family protein n=1 Tax=Streptomyces sp. NBC_00237 TaxID=2975687 RepID=UPI0022539E27|nr:potassium channel family protein [Streptomyces sp. NBC_00237]MCX5206643.1 potassium channel family protein [Streptomyces sp. NBC_00237]
MTTHSHEAAVRWHRPTLLAVSAAVMVAVYFWLPLHVFGHHRPFLSWTALACGLVLVAVGLLVQIQYVLANRGGSRPAWIIAGLMCLTILLFSATYYVLAQQQDEFDGLRTRLDALYFTVVTLATIGFGDVSPTGQTARAVTLLQVLYSFVFLTAGATTLTRDLRRHLLHRKDKHPRHD